MESVNVSITSITHLSIYVADQDQACTWYCDNLGFQVCADDSGSVANFRWLTVSPGGNTATQFVLMLATHDDEKSRVGTNAMTVLGSDNCRADCEQLKARGVEIVDPPSELPWGTSAIIRDLYGNPYNLVQAK